MPINAEHAGRRYPATKPYLVTSARIAEFAAAIGDDNPAYTGEEPIAPPTFSTLIAAQAWGALFDDPELEISLHRTMHADQRFRITRSLRTGDLVSATATIEKVRIRGNTEMITVDVALTGADGEDLGSAISQLIHNRQAS
ncbi:hypothetical protein HMPREF1531_00207 [Propionibacterium sp. oral taxon 192 str. F0372]|uniref:FAS1-like dehydratase domain-containing protein n=1 Tax=Propionibacterium sp. oral taxon 192 TaxID=671222 RepID=UPI0003540736|nr:MaoC family dehydratase N-terminal domain-containing protein [Propionibacterium sp. oral taxon 192]EPH07157.1 hypothetical protein HMPREF1531_00207 [Propionibacterium sp. oral taxon 192 str. F0372]